MERSAPLPPRMPYSRARALLLAGGVLVLVLLAAIAYVSQADPDPVEINATLLYIPVFIGFMFWKIPGGLVAGALAAAAYAFLRYPAAQSIGADIFAIQVASKAAFYLAFGVLGGWASKQLEMSLHKLELFDTIDDLTGLFNARFFVQDTEMEMSRATRYQSVFSVAAVEIPVDNLGKLSKRKRARLLSELGELLRKSIRSMDRAVHACDPSIHRFAVILPETGQQGGRIFAERLAARVGEFMSGKGADRSGIEALSFTVPGDEGPLEQLRELFASIDKTEHPEEAA